MLLLTAAALLPRMLLGWFLVNCIVPGNALDRLLKLALAAPIGVGASSMLAFVWIWLGLDLELYVKIEAIAVMSAAARLLWRHRSHLSFAAPRSMLKIQRSTLIWGPLIAAGTLLLLSQFAAGAVARPHGGWDAWNNWNVVARFIYRGGPQWLHTFQRVLDQPGYPMLLGISNAATWALIGQETARGPLTLALMFTLSLAALLAAVIRQIRGGRQAALAALFVLSLPMLASNGAEQIADVPLACYFLIAAGLLPIHDRTRLSSVAVIAGLAAGIGAWTKDEGLSFALVAGALWLVYGLRRRQPIFWPFVAGISPGLVLVALFKLFLAPPSYVLTGIGDRLAFLVDPNRYLLVLQEIGAIVRASAPAAWLPMPVLLCYALIVGRSPERPGGLTELAIAASFQGLTYLCLYLIGPSEVAWQVASTAGRLYLHLLPLILLAIFASLKSPDELAPSPSAGIHASNH